MVKPALLRGQAVVAKCRLSGLLRLQGFRVQSLGFWGVMFRVQGFSISGFSLVFAEDRERNAL